MIRYNTFTSLNIFDLTLEKWEFPLHKHNFYEIIFIDKGAGIHHINNMFFAYKKKDIMLITPEDIHQFSIKEKTTFIYIKFTKNLIREIINQEKYKFLTEFCNNIFSKKCNFNNTLINQKNDIKHLFELAHIMKYEYKLQPLSSKDIIAGLFTTMLIILYRNAGKIKPIKTANNTNKEEVKLNAILDYIHSYTLENHKMKIKTMAKHFSISPNYISAYVKKYTGLSINQHKMKIKIKTAEKLLSEKKHNVNEVAEKLGFIDSSHFNKIFKKYKNTNPSQFS